MANVKKIIADLKGDFGGSNDEQMKAIQLLKGLATSDDALANKFMKALNTATTKIAGSMTERVIEITEDTELPGTGIVLEKGDRIVVLKEAAASVMLFKKALKHAGMNLSGKQITDAFSSTVDTLYEADDVSVFMDRMTTVLQADLNRATGI